MIGFNGIFYQIGGKFIYLSRPCANIHIRICVCVKEMWFNNFNLNGG